MKYKVLNLFTYKGLQYKAGDVIELSTEEAKTFAPGFIEGGSKSSTKAKGTVTKKTK